jgi:hypothetical protein
MVYGKGYSHMVLRHKVFSNPKIEVRIGCRIYYQYADFLSGSHIRDTREVLPELLHEPIVLETTSFIADRVANPPFPWVDAKNTRSGKKWGITLQSPTPA